MVKGGQGPPPGWSWASYGGEGWESERRAGGGPCVRGKVGVGGEDGLPPRPS